MQHIAPWRRLTPRARFTYLKVDDGIITDDVTMAEHIRTFWKAVFQVQDHISRHCSEMRDITMSVPAAGDFSNEPFDIDEVKASMSRHDSAPGPDGLCYLAWKAAGNVGTQVILDVTTSMWNGDPPPPSRGL
jgi:hypothetical protein